MDRFSGFYNFSGIEKRNLGYSNTTEIRIVKSFDGEGIVILKVSDYFTSQILFALV